jgi:hypothetical protein
VSTSKRRIYRERIKISRADMHWLRSGRKRCTIRMGTASVDGDRINVTDGTRNVPVRILRVINDKRFGDLSEEEAHDEGFGTRDELITDLKKYYPRALETDPVTIIYFEPLDSAPSLF